MTASYYSSIIFSLIGLSLLSCCFASGKSSSYSTMLDTADADTRQVKSTYDEEEQSHAHDYIDESKYRKASYQHEQSLLANIYSSSRTYVSMHDDRIHPSNFSYFTFNNLGTYRFILISLRGDADLYISTRHKHVTYDNYEYSSCTCGIDEVLIDSYMKRPIYIGIYGHSQYQISYYRLLIELVDSTIPLDGAVFDRSKDDESYPDAHEGQTSRKNPQSPRVAVEGEEGRHHVLWNVLLWLLNVLVEVLT